MCRIPGQVLKFVEPLFHLDNLLLKTWVLTLPSEDYPWLIKNVPEAIPFVTSLTASLWKKYHKTLKYHEVSKAWLWARVRATPYFGKALQIWTLNLCIFYPSDKVHQPFFLTCQCCLETALVAFCFMTVKIQTVYNHWTGLVDWTGELERWTDTKNHFYASNKIQLPVGLHIYPPNSLHLPQDWFDGKLLIFE